MYFGLRPLLIWLPAGERCGPLASHWGGTLRGLGTNATVQKQRDLIGEIRQAEALLIRLEAEREAARTRLAELRAELGAEEAGADTCASLQDRLPSPLPRTAEEKVRLFRRLFRGRADVFPTRFVSKRTGKPGYAPACTNKFVRGVCELPKVKCGSVPTRPSSPSMTPQ